MPIGRHDHSVRNYARRQRARGSSSARSCLTAIHTAETSSSGPSYGALLRVEGFPGLVVSQLLGRVAGRMLSLALVLFVLSRYQSPQLAGAATFLLLFPGLLCAPIAGALLDRHGRTRLITLDYAVAAVSLFAIALLSARHLLAPPVLLAICGIASLTGPLSWAGLRSMFPSLVPGHLWERANAVDSSSDVLASVIGAPLGGVLVGWAGGEWALAATATLFAASAVAMLRVHDSAPKQPSSGVIAEAWSGVVYVLRNRSLVGLALTFITFGAGWGIVVIAMPVLMLGRLHQGPAVIGLIWGMVGVTGLIAIVFVGRMNTLGRERRLMSASLMAMALALALMPTAASVFVVILALVGVAVLETPFDIGFLTLRQRRTDPSAFGRMFAISMALNQLGSPLGSVLSGPLIKWSLTGALWVATGLVAASAVIPLAVIPVHDKPASPSSPYP